MEKIYKGEITFRTHSVVVECMDARMYCFKHNDNTCDMQIFTDYDEMIEWTLEAFPTIMYGLVIDEKR
jgi:hypothetical protein